MDSTILNMFADNISSVSEMIGLVFDGVENFVGKVENAGYQHFLLFHDVF